jgi:hypothetical protein
VEPIKTERSNYTYLGHPLHNVEDLSCEVHFDEGETGMRQVSVASVWELTDEERINIAKGHNVKLTLLTEYAVPPAMLEVVDDVRSE